jgi:hypothetical protein
VRHVTKMIAGNLLGAAALAGCSNDYGPRYVERVPVAAPGTPQPRHEYDRPRPLPDQPGWGADRPAPGPNPNAR